MLGVTGIGLLHRFDGMHLSKRHACEWVSPCDNEFMPRMIHCLHHPRVIRME